MGGATLFSFMDCDYFFPTLQIFFSTYMCFMDRSNHQEKQTDTDTDAKNILIRSSIRNFHFLHISEERHSDVWTSGADLLPEVEGGLVGFSENIKLFSHTKFACFCHWIEWLATIQDFPTHFVFRTPCFAFPDV